MKKILISSINTKPEKSPWWLVSIGWIAFFFVFVSSNNNNEALTSFVFAVVMTILVWIGNRSSQNMQTGPDKIIYFKQHTLKYQEGNATLWQIPYSLISHVENHQHGEGTLLNPTASFVLIHTNDGDSYCLPNDISQENVITITQEINRIKSNVKPRCTTN